MESTAALLEKIETCTLPDFTKLLYNYIKFVKVRGDIPSESGTLSLAENRTKFVMGVNGGNESARLLMFVHIVLYTPFVIHGFLPIDEEELPFFAPYAGNGAAGRFLNQYYPAIKQLFDVRAQ
jgi:hypothetical protein